jgi:hypothetical protein
VITQVTIFDRTATTLDHAPKLATQAAAGAESPKAYHLDRCDN